MQGIKGYDFDMYLDIHKLMHGKRDISHPLVKKFLKNKAPYESLRSYAKYSDGSLPRGIQVLCTGIIVILVLTSLPFCLFGLRSVKDTPETCQTSSQRLKK